MSKIELIGEKWRENIQGMKLDQKLIDAIIEKQTQETIEKVNHLHEACFVVVTNPKTGKIKDIGFNCIDDMILNNFGRFVTSMTHPLMSNTGVYLAWPMTDDGGVARTPYMHRYVSNYDSEFDATNTEYYTAIRFGSSTSSVARTDYNIFTPFTTAPESGYVYTSGGYYGGGKTAFAGSIVAGGSGTVNELGAFLHLRFTWSGSPMYGYMMMFHDHLSSGVSFVAGDKLDGVYSVAI